MSETIKGPWADSGGPSKHLKHALDLVDHYRRQVLDFKSAADAAIRIAEDLEQQLKDAHAEIKRLKGLSK
jgi:hypothetical protein